MLNVQVISKTLELLETMKEAINYVEERLEKLDTESTITVLGDTIEAFAAIEGVVIQNSNETEENELKEKTEELKNKLSILVKEYEKDSGKNLVEIVRLSLKPVFENWKEEIEIILRPYIVS